MTRIIELSTPEDIDNEQRITKGLKIISRKYTGSGLLLIVEDSVEDNNENESDFDISTLSRSKLDRIAESLRMNPKEFSNKAKIIAAITDKASAEGIDISKIIGEV